MHEIRTQLQITKTANWNVAVLDAANDPDLVPTLSIPCIPVSVSRSGLGHSIIKTAQSTVEAILADGDADEMDQAAAEDELEIFCGCETVA
jgi:hypothetical protein